ncbi:MAG: TIR domain-containing protein, partial [Chloroflexi bacterium]
MARVVAVILSQREEPTHSKVFISYRRSESSAFALLLKTSLQKEGIDAFIDVQNLIPGEQWDAALQREIASNDAFVCL